MLAASLTAVYGGLAPAGRRPATAFQAKEKQVPVLGIKVVKTFPHDPHAFTQGLEYYGGFLYESTGETGQSSVRKIELETGKVLQKTELSPECFGEGLTIFQGKIYQLTWLTKVGFVYDLGTFRKLREFHFYGEGWGLAHDAKNLILSDGTNTLRYLDPETFVVVRKLEVYDGKQAVTNLNELEYIDNDIYANVWHANRIARIDARSAKPSAWRLARATATARSERSTPRPLALGNSVSKAQSSAPNRAKDMVSAMGWNRRPDGPVST